MIRIRSSRVANGTSLTNSTSEGSLDQVVFAPYEFQVGKKYRVRFQTLSPTTNSTDTLTIRVRFGSSTTLSSNTVVAATAAVDQADNDVCVGEIVLEQRTSTDLQIIGWITDPDAPGSKLAASVRSSITLNPAVTNYLDVTGQWSAASASDICYMQVLTLEEIA